MSAAGVMTAGGRRYRIDLDTLNVESLREVQRLLRDLDHERRPALNRRAIIRWVR